MRRRIAKGLILWLCISCLGMPASLAQQEEKPLVIGVTTEFNGGFFTDMWGNNSADMDIRGTLHGCSTIVYGFLGKYEPDPTVVDKMEAVDLPNGDRTYTFELKRHLRYSDGSPIMAADYVFSILLQSCPDVRELGGMNTTYSHLVGAKDFSSALARGFAGVRLLSDWKFSLTIRKDALPHYYELMLVRVTPYPISVIAPGCKVMDDGKGAYLANAEESGGEVFSAKLLKKTLQDPKNGYISHPSLVSGPYQLVSYDAKASTVELKRNPHYGGNYLGRKPEFETVQVRYVPNGDIVQALAHQKVDLINKVSKSAVIEECLKLRQEGQLRLYNYPRNGFTFLGFACEYGPTQSLAVRKAITLCIDEQALLDGYLQGYGVQVYGYYGLGQWMANEKGEELNELNTNAMNLNDAKATLIEDGWVLNAKGDPYAEGKDKVRYKEMDGELAPLKVKWAKVKGSELSDQLQLQLEPALAMVGIQLDVEEMSFSQMLDQYYRMEERKANLFVLGTNFTHLFDPEKTYSVEDNDQGVQNTSGLRDEKLMRLAADMRRTDSQDMAGYADKWLAFQRRWHEVMPAAPLFSNVYFDFTQTDLHGYAINSNWSWSSLLPYLSHDPVADEAVQAALSSAVGEEE